jgi:hypothetical protein
MSPTESCHGCQAFNGASTSRGRVALHNMSQPISCPTPESAPCQGSDARDHPLRTATVMCHPHLPKGVFHRVSDRDRGFGGAAPSADAVVAGRQRGVLRPTGGFGGSIRGGARSHWKPCRVRRSGACRRSRSRLVTCQATRRSQRGSPRLHQRLHRRARPLRSAYDGLATQGRVTHNGLGANAPRTRRV